MKCPNPKCKAENEASAHFCHICGTKLADVSPDNHISEIDKILLEIIKENSYSKRILAAYDGRQYANSVAKTIFGKEKKNYKEHVEMLMRLHYPQELEKSILGAEYRKWWRRRIEWWFTLVGVIRSYFIRKRHIDPIREKLKSMCE